MGSSNEPNGLHVKGLGGAHFLVLPEAHAFGRHAKCKDRRQNRAQKSEWRNRMSLQGQYLWQVVLGDYDCVKLPDVFTVWAANMVAWSGCGAGWCGDTPQQNEPPSRMAHLFCQMGLAGMPYAFAIRRRQSQTSRLTAPMPSRAREEGSGVVRVISPDWSAVVQPTEPSKRLSFKSVSEGSMVSVGWKPRKSGIQASLTRAFSRGARSGGGPGGSTGPLGVSAGAGGGTGLPGGRRVPGTVAVDPSL